MTQQQMIEILQISFPGVLEKTLRVILNSANNQFVEETRIIRDKQTIQTTPDQTEYSFSEFAVGEANPLYIQRVFLGEDELLRIPEHEDKAWTTRKDTLIVGRYGSFNGKVALSALPAGKDITIMAVYEDPGFSADLQAEPNYPSAFHEAILSRAYERLYSIKGNLDLTRYYRAEYEAYRRRAKVYVGSQGTKGQYQTHQFNFRGV